MPKKKVRGNPLSKRRLAPVEVGSDVYQDAGWLSLKDPTLQDALFDALHHIRSFGEYGGHLLSEGCTPGYYATILSDSNCGDALAQAFHDLAHLALLTFYGPTEEVREAAWEYVDATVPRLMEALMAGQPDPDDDRAALDLPPLSHEAQQVARYLCTLPPAQGRVAKQLAKMFNLGEARIYQDIVPELEPHGLMNRSRIGYFIPVSRRPALLRFLGPAESEG